MDTNAVAVASPSVAATTSEGPVMVLTERAIAQVKQVIAEQKLDGHFLTVRVVPAGCSGLGYDLNLIDKSKDGDLVWEQDGVKMCTDAMSMQYLKGTQVDYLTSTTASGFKFENPNAKSSCGCGSSFSA